jgi:ribosomal protein S18 acetylase RimI-like enzyme
VKCNWRIRELAEPDTIRPYLNSDRLYAAYALGDLEPALFPHCRWWLAEANSPDRTGSWALLLHFARLTPHAAVCLGHASGVGRLLAQAPLPTQVYLVCRPEHLGPARKALVLPSLRLMARMVLEPERFCPAPAGNTVHLTMDALEDLLALFATDGDAADAFAPYQLEDGCFYGVKVEGQLVSVAGTHLLAPTEKIGAVGNVFTHVSHRGRGYAAACTSAVCTDLLRSGLTVVLNVHVENTPALHLYQRLGFQEHCRYHEGIGTRIIKEQINDKRL